MHGWEQSAIGSSIIGEHFVGKLGLEPKYRYANAGYLIDWANSIGIISTLLELPTATHSHADVVNGNYAGKIIEGLTEIMGTSSSSTGGNYNGKIKLGTEWVNVRSQPIVADNNYLGQLHGGDPIEILAKVKPYGDSYYWYKIVFVKNGERLQAYVREDFVTVTGEIPKSDIPAGGGEPSKIDIAYQTVGQVNDVAPSVHVRKGAGTGAGCDVVTSVNSGELLMILGEVQPGGETLPWYEIDINGQELYIRSDFVDIVSETKLDEQGTISSSEGWVHVRKLPGTGAECTIITTLNNGVSVEIVGKLQPKGESLPWYRIKMQSGVGFIRSDFIRSDINSGNSGTSSNSHTNSSDSSGNSNSTINSKYYEIVKAFGFNVNHSLEDGLLAPITGSNNIEFQATAIVLNEDIDMDGAAKIVNGQVVNAKESIEYLANPFGSSGIIKIASLLENGFILLKKTTDINIEIIIKAVESNKSLKINLQCVSKIEVWENFVGKVNPYTQAEKGFKEAVSKVTVGLVVLGFFFVVLGSQDRVANAQELIDVEEEVNDFLHGLSNCNSS